MIKEHIGSVLLCLGLAQMVIQPNKLVADGDCCKPVCCEPMVVPGDPLDSCCVNAGYALPAAIETNCSWNFYAKGDFIYYGANPDITPPVQRYTFVDGVNFLVARTTKDMELKSPYHPGFRISVGIDIDSVILDASYMRYHAATTTNFNSGANQGIAIVGAAGSTLATSLVNQQPALFSRVSQRYTINLDRLLVSLQTSVYAGKRMIINLNYGIMSYLLEQEQNMNVTPIAAPPPGVRTSSGFAKFDYKAWGVGPNLGFKAVGLLPWHFQGIFTLNLALEYGYMDKGRAVNAFPQAPLTTNNTTLKREKSGYIDANQEAEIGIGWGDYFCCDKYHVNLYVTYNFINQYIVASGWALSETAVDPYYQSYSLHGISIGGRIDF